MREAVDEVIALRAHDPRGFSRMVSVSMAIHVTAVTLLFLAPRLGWIEQKQPERVLVISLGSAGPREAGPTTIGGRPIDQVAPEPKRPQVVQPAAAKPDVMQVPTKAVPPKATKAPPPKEQPKAPSTVTQPPTTGRQVTPGNSRAETGVRGIGTGLTIGGGGAGTDQLLSDFCCPGYLRDVENRIKARWNPAAPERGMVTVRFTVQRNGEVTGLTVVNGGRSYLLERASLDPFRGLQLPPLPPEYTPATLILQLPFEYK
jgi:TonB family protein